MNIGDIYTFRWYDIEDCTLMLSRDGGGSWETLASNVITTNDESVPLEGYYVWTVTGPSSSNCVAKFIDNSDGTELLGDTFVVGDESSSSGGLSSASSSAAENVSSSSSSSSQGLSSSSGGVSSSSSSSEGEIAEVLLLGYIDTSVLLNSFIDKSFTLNSYIDKSVTLNSYIYAS